MFFEPITRMDQFSMPVPALILDGETEVTLVPNDLELFKPKVFQVARARALDLDMPRPSPRWAQRNMRQARSSTVPGSSRAVLLALKPVLNYSTGRASPYGASGIDPVTDISYAKVDLGKGLSSSPTIHRGSKNIYETVQRSKKGGSSQTIPT